MNLPSQPRAPDRIERLTALALFVLTLVVLLLTQREVGFTRDESVYFAAAESYANWFRVLGQSPTAAFSDEVITRYWEINHEHPVLMKALFGLSYLLFDQRLGWLSPSAAFRVPAFAVAALIPALVYLMGARIFGRKAALFAALSFYAVPRQFYHAHLACFDVPVAATWLLTVYAYWRAETDRRWWIYSGLAFGLAIATKHNALFIPFVLLPFALTRAVLEQRQTPKIWPVLGRLLAVSGGFVVLLGLVYLVQGPTGFQSGLSLLSPQVTLIALFVGASGWLLYRLLQLSLDTFRPLAALMAMAVLGPLVFYAHWPYLWHHPVDRTAWYLSFHATHNHYAWYYLGRLLREPPFPLDYVLIKTALTVPVSLLVPMTLGWLAAGVRSLGYLSARVRALFPRPDASELLVLVNAIVSIAIISHPNVPHFGGVKHWFPSMPFLALFAGQAVVRGGDLFQERLQARVRRPLPSWLGTAALSGLLLVPAVIATARVYAFGTSAYGELAGGLPGAATLGMQRQYWSNNVTGVLPWINEHAPKGARIYLHEVNGYSFRDYQRNGMLRPDLQPAGSAADAQLVAYQYHQEFREQEFEIWQTYGTSKPVHGLYLDETPQVVVFARP